MTIITIMTMINMTMMIIYNNHDQDDQHGFIDTGMNWLMEKFQLYIPDVWHFSVNKMNKFSNRILSRVCHHNGCFALFHEQKWTHFQKKNSFQRSSSEPSRVVARVQVKILDKAQPLYLFHTNVHIFKFNLYRKPQRRVDLF